MNKEQIQLLATCLVIIKQADERAVFKDGYMQGKVKEVLDMEKKMIADSLNRKVMDDTPPFDDGSLRKKAFKVMFGGKL